MRLPMKTLSGGVGAQPHSPQAVAQTFCMSLKTPDEVASNGQADTQARSLPHPWAHATHVMQAGSTSHAFMSVGAIEYMQRLH